MNEFVELVRIWNAITPTVERKIYVNEQLCLNP